MDHQGEQSGCKTCSATAVTVISIIIHCILKQEGRANRIPREPSGMRDLHRKSHMRRILYGSESSCLHYLRMRSHAFMNLAGLMRQRDFLKDTIHVSVEEQLAMFLHIVGHKSKNRVMQVDFIRSGSTVSRYFHLVMQAVCAIRDMYMKQAPNETPLEIVNNPEWYPFFKDCIGLIDGTHIDAMLPANLVPRFRGRKGVTQNVLAATTPNKRFTYVMTGWEGSANDFTILKDALSLPPPNGLRVYDGKYYLCDAGYTTMPGFISPYMGVRYHLKDHTDLVPRNHKELFNLRHSSLRTKIESTFGILKNKFKILTSKPHYPFTCQVDTVLACTVLHNYIQAADPHDPQLLEDVDVIEEDGDVIDEQDDSIIDLSQQLPIREQTQQRYQWKLRRDQIAWEMWVDYCNIHNHGNTLEHGL